MLCDAIRTALVFIVTTAAGAQPIAHWTFDEGGGVTAADSVGALDGTVVGPAVFVGGGVAGNAIEFPSAGYVTMGDVLPMTGGVDFSVSFWVRTAPGYALNGFPVNKHRSTVVAGYFFAINPSGTYGRPNRAWFYTSEVPGNEANSTTHVNDGSWHHIVGAYAAGLNKRIYVDGAPVEDFGTPSTINNVSAPFMIGGIDFPGSGPANLFAGAVDDLQVYDYVLCDTEVQFLFDNPGAVHVIPCLADFNDDTFVNTSDVLAFLNAWVQQNTIADVNCDFLFNTSDLLEYLNLWVAGCP